MNWVIVDNDPPGYDPGDVMRTIAWEGGWPRYQIEGCLEGTIGGHSVYVKLWVQWGDDQEWHEAQVVSSGMVCHIIEVLHQSQEKWGPVCFESVKLTSDFGKGSVFDPDEVRWAPEGETVDWGQEQEPFWTDGVVPHVENLRGMVELAIDQVVPLGSYLESSSGQPLRLIRVADDDWNHAPYLSACRHIGEERRYMISNAEIQFRQRCEPWFDRDRITEVILAVIRGQPTPD